MEDRICKFDRRESDRDSAVIFFVAPRSSRFQLSHEFCFRTLPPPPNRVVARTKKASPLLFYDQYLFAPLFALESRPFHGGLVLSLVIFLRFGIDRPRRARRGVVAWQRWRKLMPSPAAAAAAGASRTSLCMRLDRWVVDLTSKIGSFYPGWEDLVLFEVVRIYVIFFCYFSPSILCFLSSCIVAWRILLQADFAEFLRSIQFNTCVGCPIVL